MQASQNNVILTVIVASVILLVCGFFAVISINSNLALATQALNKINVPSTEAIVNGVLAGIVIPSADNEKLDKVCSLTDGCEYYELNDSEGNKVYKKINATNKDFKEELSDLLDIDEDYLNIIDINIKDKQVRAYSKSDKNDENYEVKAFVRVEYEDTDVDEKEVVYIVVTSILDKGKYDSLSIEEVTRSFEFD